MLLGLLCLGLKPLSAEAVSVRLRWQANPENNIANYKVYVGTNTGVYTRHTIVTNAGLATNAVISGLIEGITYYFAVTAINNIGLEGLPSNELSLQFPLQSGFTFPCDSLRVQTNGNISFSLSGPVGRYFVVQTSTNLVHWIALSTNLFTNSSLNLNFIESVPKAKRRFYRSRLL